MQYLTLEEFYHQVPQAAKVKHLMDIETTQAAKGSNHNHQIWEGGYIDHVVETLNITTWLYTSSPRPMPFKLEDALLVMFLHDLEKPFKAEHGHQWESKSDRRNFRETLIQRNHIRLTPEQWNALNYVEGEYEDYSNTERKMQPLAALCHMADIASSRLWFDKGKEHQW